MRSSNRAVWLALVILLLVPGIGLTQTGVCGDQNGDGALTVGDVFYLINNLFAGGPGPANCPSLRSVNAGTSAQLAGLYSAFNLAVVDPDLAPTNIRSGVTIYGIAGDTNVVNTATGDAAAGDIASGKKAWVAGAEVTGTAVGGGGVLAAVAKTGQTTCYDTAGGVIACAGTGQDGELRKGVAWPNPRFTDNGNGTVRDNLTGLVWLKNANCFGQQTWANALTSANTLASGACGLTDGSVAGDWRLPNVQALQSLIHYGYIYPALSNAAGTGQWTEGSAFSGVQSNDYWSSSTYVSYAADAWIVNLYGGVVWGRVKTEAHYVWPVRGGQ
jgi:Protein of unknown function (DUF1566)